MCSDRGASFAAVTLVSEDIPDQGLEEEGGERVQVGSACNPQRAYESPPSREEVGKQGPVSQGTVSRHSWSSFCGLSH